MEKKVKAAIIGAGSAGLYALGQVRKVTDDFVIIDGGKLGTTCARVGCMPSKQLIHIADHYYRRHKFAAAGVQVSGLQDQKPDIKAVLAHVRQVRDAFVEDLIANSVDPVRDRFIEGYAHFLSPNCLEVAGERISAERIIIAAGSSPMVPPAWQPFKDRIITSDTLFEQPDLPESMAVIGLGAVGLEVGISLYRLGIKVTGIDMLESIGGLEDPVVAAEAVSYLRGLFPLWLGHEARISEQADGRLQVAAGDKSIVVDKVFAGLGRLPNLADLGLEKLGTPLDNKGVPLHNPQTMQVGALPVFIAGDVTGQRQVLHEAADEGRIAGYNAVREKITAFTRKPPFQIIFSNPDIAVVGAKWSELNRKTAAIGDFWLRFSGRAKMMQETGGVIRLYADTATGRLLGGALMAAHGENLAHLLVWAVMRKLTVEEVLRMPFYHPTIEEALQRAFNNLRRAVGLKKPALPELEAVVDKKTPE